MTSDRLVSRWTDVWLAGYLLQAGYLWIIPSDQHENLILVEFGPTEKNQTGFKPNPKSCDSFFVRPIFILITLVAVSTFCVSKEKRKPWKTLAVKGWRQSRAAAGAGVQELVQTSGLWVCLRFRHVWTDVSRWMFERWWRAVTCNCCQMHTALDLWFCWFYWFNMSDTSHCGREGHWTACDPPVDCQRHSSRILSARDGERSVSVCSLSLSKRGIQSFHRSIILLQPCDGQEMTSLKCLEFRARTRVTTHTSKCWFPDSACSK